MAVPDKKKIERFVSVKVNVRKDKDGHVIGKAVLDDETLSN